jgi:carbamate kinase
VDLFLISTDVDCVYLDYRKPTQRPLHSASPAELQQYADAGHFPPGNMGPKVESVLRFVTREGREAIISSPENLSRAVEGSAGTHIAFEQSPVSRDMHGQIELPVGSR